MRSRGLALVGLVTLLVGGLVWGADAPIAAVPTPFDVKTGSLVTFRVTDASLIEVLKMVALQTGNKPLSLPPDFVGKPVTVIFDHTPYWQAIDGICSGQGLIVQPDYRNRSLTLVPVQDVREITAYAGPVVFRVIAASKTRTYYGSQVRAGLTYSVSFLWEDRLGPSWIQPAVAEKVTDEAGQELKTTEQNAGPMSGRRGWRGGNTAVVSGVPMSHFTIGIADFPDKLRQLKELGGQVTMAFVEGSQEIRIENSLAEGEKSGAVGPYKFRVAKVERRGEWVTIDATLTKDGQPQDMRSYGADQRYGVWLVDDEGKEWRGNVGPLGRLVQGAVGGDQGQVRIQVMGGGAGQDNAEQQGGNRITFTRVPEGQGPVALRYVFPAKVAEETYRFKFTEVPVP